MALQILRDCKLYLGGYNLSGDMSAHTLDYKADVKEATVFNDTSKRRLGGLANVSIKHEGVWQAGLGLIDDVLFSNLGQKDTLVTLCPTTGAEAEPAYFFEALQANYSPSLKMGDALRFSVQADGSDGNDLVRGTVIHNATKTVSGSGTIFNLGGVTSPQRLFAGLHVIAASGTTPSLIVTIQSAAALGFGTPTTRFTFNTATGITSQNMPPNNAAITDAYWRVSYTIAGTTPSFTFVTSLGIQV